MEPLKTVAIADDDPGVCKYLRSFLNSRGYTLAGEAVNGIEAVNLVRSSKPNLILMDIHMPLMDGLEATRQITALNTTAVVILTADIDPATARQAMDLGACGYVQKPCDIAQIAAIMESAWHRFQTVKALKEETKVLAGNLETRKLLEKAKGILMEQQGFSEEEAHRTIQKMAQDQGITVKELCRSLIQVRMVLGQKLKHPANRKAA